MTTIQKETFLCDNRTNCYD